MARVRGTVASFHPLGKRDQLPDPALGLHNLSIEGIGCLVKPELVPAVTEAVKSGEVEAVLTVQWKKGKSPNHWLAAITPLKMVAASTN